MKNISVLLTGLILTLSTNVFAQESKEAPGTYIKLGLVHSQGKIEWADYVLNGLSVEVETYFEDNHLGLSGWSLGYRKEDFQHSEFGHLLSADVFRTESIKIADFKFGGGVEWGMPSNGFSRTKFNSQTDSDISYSHVFLNRNSNIPRMGTKRDGTLYPFMKFSLVKRNKFFILEGGTRISIMKFGIDEYSVSGNNFRAVMRDRRIAIPSVFISIGLGTG